MGVQGSDLGYFDEVACNSLNFRNKRDEEDVVVVVGGGGMVFRAHCTITLSYNNEDKVNQSVVKQICRCPLHYSTSSTSCD